jgi:hypothetical protein
MAEHSSNPHHAAHGMDEHRATYDAFLRGSVLLVLLSLMICVALVMFRFAESGNVLMGFGGLIIGMLALLIDLRSGSEKWMLSIGWTVIFGLITAVSVS